MQNESFTGHELDKQSEIFETFPSVENMYIGPISLPYLTVLSDKIPSATDGVHEPRQ